MFFLHERERTITLHPSFFGQHIKEYLKTRLIEDVEGTCEGLYYNVCVLDATDISEGRVLPSTALAEFVIRYRCVVWRPFRGETADGIVTSLNQLGIFVKCGPLQVFISSHLMPEEIKFDANATPPQYTDHDTQIIERGTSVRLKIVGIRTEGGSIYAVGSIKEDYLGPLP